MRYQRRPLSSSAELHSDIPNKSRKPRRDGVSHRLTDQFFNPIEGPTLDDAPGRRDTKLRWSLFNDDSLQLIEPFVQDSNDFVFVIRNSGN
jgi:hypothetical protein